MEHKTKKVNQLKQWFFALKLWTKSHLDKHLQRKDDREDVVGNGQKVALLFAQHEICQETN